ncbi:SGNH/GDSL hydrolase family protein, partial [Arthrobacter deserti]|nr:SGNH/GDSL hydrolase family protein [Arthrobacter deserti]
ELTTVAVPGITAGRILAHVPRGRAFDVVVVEAGTNDAGRTGVQGFEADYAALPDAPRAQSRDAVLVCLGAWGRPAAVGDYDDAVASQCRRQDGTFRPLGQLYEDNRWEGGVMPDGRKVDDSHPNDAGHALIAGLVLDALRSS